VTPLCWAALGRSLAEILVQRAREFRAHLIAMTTQGRGTLRRLAIISAPGFGSVTNEVLQHAPCLVLLVRVSEASPRHRRHAVSA